MVLVSSGSRMFPSLSRTTRSRSRYLARFISGHKPKHKNCQHASLPFSCKKNKAILVLYLFNSSPSEGNKDRSRLGQILLSPNHSLLLQRWKSSLYLNTALKFHHRSKMALHHFHFQSFSLVPLQTQQEASFHDEMECGLLEPKSRCFVRRLNDDLSSSLDWQFLTYSNQSPFTR